MVDRNFINIVYDVHAVLYSYFHKSCNLAQSSEIIVMHTFYV